MKHSGRIKLSPRLLACAEYVPENTTLIDVGTDHAYLPVWLVQNHKIKVPAVACDINAGPLSRARASAEQYEVEDSIEFILNNGLAGMSGETAETVVIAGMGGETIAGIIEASGWKWTPRHTFILQPMSKIPELCRYIYENGFYIEKERLVRDGKEIYRVMRVKVGRREMPGALELYTGVLDADDPLSTEYLGLLLKKFRRAAAGMEGSEKADSKTIDELRGLATETEALVKELEKHENRKGNI